MVKKIIEIFICMLFLLSTLPVVGIIVDKNIINNNEPPDPPSFIGPRTGKPGILYNYMITGNDPDSMFVYFFIDWGDGTNTDWIGPYIISMSVIINHTWLSLGKFIIKAKAKDNYSESDWVNFEVKIPRSRAFYNFNWFSLLERYPILEKIISSKNIY